MARSIRERIEDLVDRLDDPALESDERVKIQEAILGMSEKYASFLWVHSEHVEWGQMEEDYAQQIPEALALLANKGLFAVEPISKPDKIKL